MIGLLSFVVRVVVLAGFTFGFVVLFEHGPQGFVAGAPVELDKFEAFLVSLKNRQQAPAAPEPAPAPAVPQATPAPTPVTAPVPPPATPAAGSSQPSAWEQLQSRPVGAGIDTPVATPFPTDN
jgi:hypothetical protein